MILKNKKSFLELIATARIFVGVLKYTDGVKTFILL